MRKYLSLLILLFPAIVNAQVYTLEECINMALKNNYEIRNSQLDFEMADQTKKELFTRYFPTVSASGMTFKANEYMIDEKIDLTKVNQILTGMGMDPAALGIPASLPLQMINNGTIGFVSATQPVFAGGQIINGNKLAKVGKEVSELKIRLTQNEVISKTEEYYWQIVALKEKVKTLDVVASQLAELDKTVNASVNAGVRMRNDLLRIELQQQKIESNRIKVENGIKVYKLMLCNITGADSKSFDINLPEFPEIIPPVSKYINAEDGLNIRNENMLLDKSVSAASLQHKMAVGKNMPTIAAGAGYMYHNMLDKNVDFGMVFATVSVPISGWWSGSHEIKRSRLGEIKAMNEKQNMRQMMTVEIESKWNQLQEAYLQIGIARKSVESATENLRISKDYFEAGTVSLTDLLEAQTLLQQSRDQYTDARTSYNLSMTAYLQATGRYQESGKP